MPEIKFPDVTLPEFHRSDVHLPDFDWSALKRLDLKGPEITLPDITLPEITLPEFSLPEEITNLELPDLATIRRFGRPARRSNPMWPWALVAVGAGLFGAFWLANSSMTGPKVRRIAGRARQRIDEIRAGRMQKDGADGEPAGAGWASEQDWHESVESVPARDGSTIAS